MFGNPGSTELPMLADFPDDFRYVLGLQEAVVVGMADGYAQASGQPTHRQPAHRARRRQRDGRDLQRPGQPLAAAGHRRPAGAALITLQANLTNRDATRMPHPFVKWSYEPPRAEDVPHALARGDPPRGAAAARPGLRLDPDGRLGRRGRRRRRARTRSRAGRPAAPPPTRRRSRAPRRAARRGQQPGAGRRPRHRRQRRLGRGGRARRAPAAAGLGHARARRRPHRLPRGPPELPRRPAAGDRPGRRDARGPRPDPRRRLARSSPTTPTSPAPLLPEGAELVAITSDPDEAARAPMGDAIVADVRADARGAARGRCRESDAPGARAAARARGDPPEPTRSAPRPSTRARPRSSPTTGSSSSSRRRARSRCATSCASRGPAATTSAPAAGSASASPPRSACSSPSPTGRSSACSARARRSTRSRAFWSAAAYDVPVTFLVLRNEEYAILKWFAEVEEVTGAPGLDLPALDVAAVAAGYGLNTRRSPRRVVTP